MLKKILSGLFDSYTKDFFKHIKKLGFSLTWVSQFILFNTKAINSLQ